MVYFFLQLIAHIPVVLIAHIPVVVIAHIPVVLIAHIPVVLIAHIPVVVSITPHSVAVETPGGGLPTLLKLLGERANTTHTGSTLLHEDILSIATAY